VTLGNLMSANEEVKKVSGVIEEFGSGPDAIERMKNHAAYADKLDVDMHEVIGHASGQLEKGVLTFSDTLKNYAGCLEEARADLVALYYIPDAKLGELGLVKDPDVAKAAYDAFITNALLTQLARIPLGEDIQEAHMRNRHLIAAWAMDKGGPAVIEKVEKAPGKTAFVIKDFDKLRQLFGELLKEIQRIKSQGDFKAGSELVEKYAIKIDPVVHKEVKERWDKLGVAPFTGFVGPRIVPVEEGGEIVDAKIEYVEDFVTQMREYGEKYSTLTVEN
jgi:dipeptidyl-peptidase-3